MDRIRHDGALRLLPLWLTITMLNTSVLLGVVLWRQVSPSPHQSQILQPPLTQLLVVLWFPIALYLLFGNVRTRCHRFEMTLPIPAQTLWRSHLTAVMLAGFLVLAGSMGVVALHAQWLARLGPGRILDIPFVSLTLPLLAGLMLAVSLIDAVEPGLWKLSGRKSYWILAISSLIGVLALLILLHPLPWLSTAVCLVLAFFVIRKTLRSLPAAYRLVPSTAAPVSVDLASADLASAKVSAAATIVATTGPTTKRWQVYRILFNVLHTCPPWKQFTPWMLYSLVALMGFIISGGLNRWFDASYLRFLYIPFASYMLFAGIGIITYNLYRLDALPVPRRVLFALLILPGLIIYCGAYAAGRLAIAIDAEPKPLVEYKIRPPSFWADVDEQFMGVTFGAPPPTLEAPWGETHEAWHLYPFRGVPILTYNPYNTVQETSADFEALMTSRAIEAIYNTTIPPGEIRDRYFVLENDRVVDLKEGGFTLLEDYPGLQPPSNGPETPIYMLLVLVPWLLFVALFVWSFKATSSIKTIRGMYWVGLGVLIGAMLSQVLLSVFGLFDELAARTILEVFIRRLGTGPVAWLMTWTISLLIILACYRFALAQFERAEIPAFPINCSLVDWGAED
jgi:hypothetical protein